MGPTAEHPPLVTLLPSVEVDERPARESLRGQIAKLERDLSQALADARPGEGPGRPAVRARGPRLLSLGELERVRDDLADRLRTLRRDIAGRAEREAENRLLLERMLLEPERHRWVRVTQAEVGEPGCGAYQVRPRLGPIGMLAGWWQVKLSSGCPLARGRAARAARLPARSPSQRCARGPCPGLRTPRRAPTHFLQEGCTSPPARARRSPGHRPSDARFHAATG
jgi:hypothetical protein